MTTVLENSNRHYHTARATEALKTICAAIEVIESKQAEIASHKQEAATSLHAIGLLSADWVTISLDQFTACEVRRIENSVEVRLKKVHHLKA